MIQPVIRASGLNKMFKLYSKPKYRLLESIHPLKKKYHQEYHALNNVSFEIQKGESVGIIGKNGAGKSTLLKILSGVLTPSSGTVEVNGKVAALLELGAGFNPEISGYENIFFQGAVLGYSRELMESKLEQIINFADIGDFLEQPVKLYSSGMFARLAFSIAVNIEPDILIVDEALSVGDSFFQMKCFRMMRSLIESGVSVIFVSHSLDSIRSLCDKCIFLENGNVRYYGNTVEAIRQYRLDEVVGNSSVTNFSEDSLIGDLKLFLVDSEGEPTNRLQYLDPFALKFSFQCRAAIKNLSVSCRILTKDGVKLVSWGVLDHLESDDVRSFYEKEHCQGATVHGAFKGLCLLGVGHYFVQIVVSIESQLEYKAQRVLALTDESFSFMVSHGKTQKFGGIYNPFGDLEISTFKGELNEVR